MRTSDLPFFLPVCQEDLEKQGRGEPDIIFVSGDAYVDHPSFAAPLLARFLEKHGFYTGIIAQPDWRNPEAFKRLGRPRLFFAVSAGNMDSMVNHYTADRKRRSQDLYSPGGEAGLRPDRASIAYVNRLREAFPDVPIILGGVEASLRRLAHYDYWSDSVRRSILLDSGADILVYGMGEYTLLSIARQIKAGKSVQYITRLPGTVVRSRSLPDETLELPAYDLVANDRQAFMQGVRTIMENLNPHLAVRLAQKHERCWIVHNPPPLPLSTEEMDTIYDTSFCRRSHPSYDKRGGVPALETVQFSITTHRGCFGGCSFCALALHQGCLIQSRSPAGIVEEARRMAAHPDFKGSISDVGGPSANMYGLKGKEPSRCRKCRRVSCLQPGICPNLDTDHGPSIELLDDIRRLPGVKNLRVASGIRYDLAVADASHSYIRELAARYTGGQLKIAPEHISSSVCRLMNKPGRESYERFAREFAAASREAGKKQFLLPYFIAGHPGSGIKEMLELAAFIKDVVQFEPEQAQNFTPTPMTLSTAMYYTEMHPFSGKRIYVARSAADRELQRAILQHSSRHSQAVLRRALNEEKDPRIAASLATLIKGRNQYGKAPGLGGPGDGKTSGRSGPEEKRPDERIKRSNASRNDVKSKGKGQTGVKGPERGRTVQRSEKPAQEIVTNRGQDSAPTKGKQTARRGTGPKPGRKGNQIARNRSSRPGSGKKTE